MMSLSDTSEQSQKPLTRSRPTVHPGIKWNDGARGIRRGRYWVHLSAWHDLRFHSVRVRGVAKSVPVILAACAKTLETPWIELIFYHGMRPRDCSSIDCGSPFTGWFHQTLIWDYSLSKANVLRSLQVKTTIRYLVTTSALAAIESVFCTIISRAVFFELGSATWFSPGTRTDERSKGFFDNLHRMYCVRPFVLGFLLIVLAGKDVGRVGKCSN